MVLDDILHLKLEDPRPVNNAMAMTPPGDNDSNAPKKAADPLAPPDATVMDHAFSRIYRRTPTPTVVLDGSLKVVEASDSHLALFNCNREQVLNTSIYELAPRMIAAADIASLSGALASAISTHAVQVLETVLGHDTEYYDLRVTPIFEDNTLIYVLLEAQAVTNVKQQPESRINEQTHLNETYRVLVETVREYAIFMLDTRGYISTWNSGAAMIKGYSADEIIGQHFSIFYGHDDRQANKPARELEMCLRDGKVEDEGWRYKKNGERFWANVIIAPIYQLGRHVGFVKVTRDLTERKESEKKLLDAFEEASKLKSDFLANMSHELRTPMNGMFLALTMLMRTNLTEDQREYASILEDSTSILLQLINDVLDYSKLSSGSFSLNTDVINVPSVVSAVIRNCQPSLKPGVVLESSVAGPGDLRLKGDPLRFRQLLQNMVGNAVKFTESQGGYVKVHTSYALVPDDPGTYIVSIKVVDSGIGVPDDAVSTLFTPFTRFAGSPRYQGTGLGLSICKSLAELMDGEVGYHPNPDGPGSVFWFSVKMRGFDRPEFQAGRLVSHEETTSIDSSALLQQIAPQKQLLLVEDNKVNHTIMLKLLGSLGFRLVDAAWDGAEAVRMVKQKPLAYNVILMDINMPIMDGLTATEHIRQINPDVPIIALTGNALRGDKETYLAKGMNGYAAKPLHRQQLVELLWKWCAS